MDLLIPSMSIKLSPCIWVGNFNIYLCVCVCTCNNYVSVMLLRSSYIFRRDIFMKTDTVAVHKKTSYSNNATFCPHCLLLSPILLLFLGLETPTFPTF